MNKQDIKCNAGRHGFSVLDSSRNYFQCLYCNKLFYYPDGAFIYEIKNDTVLINPMEIPKELMKNG